MPKWWYTKWTYLSNRKKVKKYIETLKFCEYFLIIHDCTLLILVTNRLQLLLDSFSSKSVDIREHFLGLWLSTPVVKDSLIFLLNYLKESDISIASKSGADYDNASSMKGYYSLQKILVINPRTLFTPGVTHSLNLVINNATKTFSK